VGGWSGKVLANTQLLVVERLAFLLAVCHLSIDRNNVTNIRQPGLEFFSFWVDVGPGPV
jgi:hypothetical protein